MITRIYIEDWRCFKDFGLDLGPVNVLVGPNGCGKTSLLDWLAEYRRWCDDYPVLVDNAGQHTHHSKLAELAEGYRDAVGDGQIVLATHNPYFVDCFKPEEVIVMWRGGGGPAKARPMAESAEVDRLRGHFRTGEIWTEYNEAEIVNGPTVAKRMSKCGRVNAMAKHFETGIIWTELGDREIVMSETKETSNE